MASLEDLMNDTPATPQGTPASTGTDDLSQFLTPSSPADQQAPVTLQDLMGGDAPQSPPEASQKGFLDKAKAVAADIGKGVTELPRAAAHGAISAGNEAFQAIDSAGDWLNSKVDLGTVTFTDEKTGKFGLGWRPSRPEDGPGQITNVAAPESTTGKLASSVAQFVTGMVGAGKFVKLGGFAGATMKGALSDAFAFDPHQERLSNLVQEVPALQNPVTDFLASKPEDGEALGRFKNALEGAGLGTATELIFLGVRAFKARKMGNLKESEVLEEQLGEMAQQAKPKDIPTEAKPAVAEALPPMEKPPLEAVGTKQQELAKEALPITTQTSDQLATMRQGLAADVEAVIEHRSVEGAEKAGYVFANKKNLLDFTKVDTADDLNKLVSDVVAEVAQKDIQKLRGGNAVGVDTWENAERRAIKLAESFGTDPNVLLGQLHVDAKNSHLAASKVLAYDQLVRSLNQSVTDLAEAYSKGRPGTYGSMEELGQALEHQLALLTDVAASTKAIVSNNARSLNILKHSKASDITASFQKGASLDDVVEAILINGGDLGSNIKNAQRHFETTGMEKAASFYQANLLWSPYTHFRNIAGNTLMLPTVPLNKIIGGTFTGNTMLAKEGVAHLAFMPSVVGDAWNVAKKAWKMKRPVLDPSGAAYDHIVDVESKLISGEEGWNNVKQIGTLLLNKAWGIQQTPFRALGTADDFFKQLVAGASVKAQAYREALERGIKDDDAIEAFVNKAYSEAYDGATGSLLNLKALDEARLATFQQAYEKGSWAENLAKFTGKHPIIRILALPFQKTPYNLWKQSFRWTPGLNFSVKEHQRMWAAGGEERAKVIGEMGVGTLIWGGGLTAAMQNKVTGGGPTDPKVRQQLQATGWRPYSYIKQNSDGSTTYVPIGNYDPFGLLLGTMADLHQVARDVDIGRYSEVEDAASALFLSVVRNARDRNYFDGFTKVLDALGESDGSDKLKRWMADTANGFVPFAAGLRAFNSDPVLRDAKGLVDRIRNSIPGMNGGISAKYNAFGEPVTKQGPLYSTSPGDPITKQIKEAVEITATAMQAPDSRIRLRNDGASVDTKKVVLKDGRNAYDVYMEYLRNPTGKEGQSLRDVIEREMAKPYFENLSDRGLSDKGSKLSVLSVIRRRYAEAAKKKLLASHPEILEEYGKAKQKRGQFYNAMADYKQQMDETPDYEGDED